MKTKTYTHVGKRVNQEDALNHTDTAFVVCDGVGGHTKGEVASNFVATRVLEIIDVATLESTEAIQEALKSIQQELNQTLIKNPEAEGMGTTFCGLFKTPKAIHISHIGDSRVYYIKPKQQQFWHTWDHSLVSYLVQTGEITREDARFHPQNNRISRAISAKENNKIAKADIETITQIEKGDLFFLCSDGVNEAWSDLDLVTLLMSKLSIEKKIATIKEQCALQSKDNNTAILLEIEDKDVINAKPNTIKMLSLQDLITDNETYIKNKSNKEKNVDNQEIEILIEEENKSSKKSILKYLFPIVIIVVLGLLIFKNYDKIISRFKKDTPKETTTKPSKSGAIIERINNRKPKKTSRKEENKNTEKSDSPPSNSLDSTNTNLKPSDKLLESIKEKTNDTLNKNNNDENN